MPPWSLLSERGSAKDADARVKMRDNHGESELGKGGRRERETDREIE